MMKKLLVLMLAIVMMLSFAACGGDEEPANVDTQPTQSASVPNAEEPDAEEPGSDESDVEEPIELVEVSGNGISLLLPSDIKFVKTNDETGNMIFANDDTTAVVTIGVLAEQPVTSDDITHEVLLATISANGGFSDASLDSAGKFEHDGGVSVAGIGKGTMPNQLEMYSAVQYFFLEDGSGYYVISYLYAVDADSSLENNIEDVLASVKVAK